MKITGTLFILFVSVLSIHCAENSATTKKNNPAVSDSAVLSFVSEKIDLGLIEYNKNANQDFKFANAGGDTLIITEAKGNCHCVQAKWPDKGVVPGDSATISVSFDPTGVTGLFVRTVMVNSNATRPAIELTITGEVKADPNKKVSKDGKH